MRATGVERAAGGLVRRARNLAFNHGLVGLQRRFFVGDDGNGRDQRAGVGMSGRIEQLSHRPDLDQAPEIEDADPGDEIAHQAEVMRNEEVSEAERAAEIVEEIDDLGLNRHVKRGRRLIEDDQLRLCGDRPRDGDALLLAARQFVRIAGGEIGGQLHHVQEARNAPIDLGARQSARLERHRDRLTDRAARVERGARVLKDHLHGSVAAAPMRLPGEIAAFEQNGAIARRREAHDHPRDRRLARAAFAGEAERFALGQGEADVVDRLHFPLDPAEQPAAQGKRLGETDDLEQRLAHAASSKRQQAAWWSAPTLLTSGGRAQAPIARGQRGAKRQPGGGAA